MYEGNLHSTKHGKCTALYGQLCSFMALPVCQQALCYCQTGPDRDVNKRCVTVKQDLTEVSTGNVLLSNRTWQRCQQAMCYCQTGPDRGVNRRCVTVKQNLTEVSTSAVLLSNRTQQRCQQALCYCQTGPNRGVNVTTPKNLSVHCSPESSRECPSRFQDSPTCSLMCAALRWRRVSSIGGMILSRGKTEVPGD